MTIASGLTYCTMPDACRLFAAGKAAIDGRVLKENYGTRDITEAERAKIEASAQ